MKVKPLHYYMSDIVQKYERVDLKYLKKVMGKNIIDEDSGRRFLKQVKDRGWVVVNLIEYFNIDEEELFYLFDVVRNDINRIKKMDKYSVKAYNQLVNKRFQLLIWLFLLSRKNRGFFDGTYKSIEEISVKRGTIKFLYYLFSVWFVENGKSIIPYDYFNNNIRTFYTLIAYMKNKIFVYRFDEIEMNMLIDDKLIEYYNGLLSNFLVSLVKHSYGDLIEEIFGVRMLNDVGIPETVLRKVKKSMVRKNELSKVKEKKTFEDLVELM